MSKCDIFIGLKRRDKTFQPGDEVTGTVDIQVNKDVKCNKVAIELCWQTHGSGNRQREILDTLEIQGSDWIAGSTYSFDFSFIAPPKPMTYHGHHLNVDHYIRVSVDIPWAIDPSTSQDFILLPGPTSQEDYKNTIKLEEEVVFKTPQKQMNKVLGWILAPIIIVLLIALVFAFWWVFLLIVAFVGLRKQMHYLANKKLGGVQVQLSEKYLTPGSSTNLSLYFSPGGKVKINAVKYILKGEEICTSGSGTNSTTHRHRIHDETVILREEFEVMPGSYNEFSERISVPDVPAYSFNASDNELKWTLIVHIDIPRYPDWKKTFDLAMVPENQSKR